MEKNKGAVSGKTSVKRRPVLDNTPTLKDLGITKTELSRWQRLAAMSKSEQEAKIEKAKKKQLAALDGAAKKERIELRAEDEKRVLSLKVQPGRYRTIVIDPPWDYECGAVG